jgi:hypothetical protein
METKTLTRNDKLIILKYKKYLVIVISVLLIITIVSIGPFIYKFRNQVISDDIHKWGLFGDYLAGIFGPIFALLNAVVLFFITMLVNKIESDNAANQMISQSNNAEIQMKHQSYQVYFTTVNEMFFNVLKFYTCYHRENNIEKGKDFELSLEM